MILTTSPMSSGWFINKWDWNHIPNTSQCWKKRPFMLGYFSSFHVLQLFCVISSLFACWVKLIWVISPLFTCLNSFGLFFLFQLPQHLWIIILFSNVSTNLEFTEMVLQLLFVISPLFTFVNASSSGLIFLFSNASTHQGFSEVET